LEFYLDGKKMEGVRGVEVTLEKECKNREQFSFMHKKEVSFTLSNESNIKLMSPGMRTMFKQIRCNGKVYW
jgi:hypothetical protein